MDAQQILKEMHAKYESITSYQDMGVVLTTWPNKAEYNQICFTTAFRRPDRFRFEWSAYRPTAKVKHSKSILWSNNTGTYHNYFGTIETDESLCLAIAGATGISNCSAYNVSSLLLPGFADDFRISDLTQLSLSEDVFEGVPCYRVVGRHPNDDFREIYEVFIGIPDLLLRRIIETDTDGVVKQEVRREIRVNKPISEKIFEMGSMD